MTASPANLSMFNTNPVCFGVGPTDTPQDPDRIVAIVIYVLAATMILTTSAWYMYVRQYRRRLRIRSLNPIVMGSIGSAIVLLVRAAYNYAGREYLSCSGNLTLIYAFFLLNASSDNMLVASFLVKQKLRLQMASKNFPVAATQKHSNTESDKKRNNPTGSQRFASGSIGSGTASPDDNSTQINKSNWVTPTRWFMGFWNHFIILSEATQFTASQDVISIVNGISSRIRSSPRCVS